MAGTEGDQIEDEARGAPGGTAVLRIALYCVGVAVVVVYALESPKVLGVVAVLALLPAFVAYRKGRSVVGWWIAGVVAWLPALVMSFLVRNERRRCPHCAARVAAAATVCPSCGTDITADARAWHDRPPEKLYGIRVVLILLASIVGFMLLLSLLAELLV